MNKILIATVLLAFLAVVIANNKLIGNSALAQFNAFQRKYNKVYASDDEWTQRLGVFKANLQRIDDLNSLAASMGSSAKFGVTEFADLTKEEFKNQMLSSVPAVRDPSVPVAAEVSQKVIRDLPVTFDWREKGAVTPVKNQGQCGSCWSFSATGNVEGQWFLAGNKLTSLSEQNLVDCDHECMEYENQKACDAGCDGGLQPNAYRYIIKNGGIDTEASYPYTAKDGKCAFNKDNVGATISNYTMISQDEDQMAAYLVAHGPLAIAADAEEWQFYFGGLFDLPCGKSLDHGILIVGYGNETTIFGNHRNYWIIKNSWGGSWGEQGYIKVLRGDGKCGLNTFVSSAIINKKN